MTNSDIAKILFEIGDYLSMEDIAFKPQAYRKAANEIKNMDRSVYDLYKEGGIGALKDLPGVGEAIARKIEEYIKTGKVRYYEDLRKQAPVNLSKLSEVEGLGPKRIRTLYERLNIKTIKDLETAAKKGKIAELEGFGKKSEENILESIEYFRKQKGRTPYKEAKKIADKFEKRLKNRPEVDRATVAGSYRRKKETVGDLDIIVVSSKPEKVMDFFVSQKEVGRVLAKGKTKSTITLKNGMDVDLRIVKKGSYGAALNYFTGDKSHNIWLRKIAQDKGMKLNEYGLFRGEKKVAGRTEEEIYKKLGLDYIKPENRHGPTYWAKE